MESFDELIRLKLADRTVPDFEEKDWLAAEKLLDEADRRRRGAWFFVWPLAGLLLAGLGWFAFFEMKERRGAAVFPEKPVEKPAENRASATDEPPILSEKKRPAPLAPVSDERDLHGDSVASFPKGRSLSIETRPNLMPPFLESPLILWLWRPFETTRAAVPPFTGPIFTRLIPLQ